MNIKILCNIWGFHTFEMLVVMLLFFTFFGVKLTRMLINVLDYKNKNNSVFRNFYRHKHVYHNNTFVWVSQPVSTWCINKVMLLQIKHVLAEEYTDSRGFKTRCMNIYVGKNPVFLRIKSRNSNIPNLKVTERATGWLPSDCWDGGVKKNTSQQWQ